MSTPPPTPYGPPSPEFGGRPAEPGAPGYVPDPYAPAPQGTPSQGHDPQSPGLQDPGGYGAPGFGQASSGQASSGQPSYGQASYGQTSYAPHPYAPDSGARAAKTPMVGLVAMIAGLVTLLGSVLTGIFIASNVDPALLNNPEAVDEETALAFGGGFMLLLLWFGFALWAIIQGSIAIAQKRGVGYGIGGLVLGIVGPWVGVIIAFTAMGAMAMEQV